MKRSCCEARYGAAMWAMGGRSGDSPDLLLAWPSAVMTGTGPASAVYTIHAKELEAAHRNLGVPDAFGAA